MARGTSGFLNKRMTELAGIAMLAVAMFFALALASYNSSDPSFNRAYDGDIANWMGAPGAWLSDLLLQVLGLGSFVLALVPLAWGVNLIAKRRTAMLWLRVSLLALCLPATSALFALIPAPIDWPIAIGLGGYVGILLKTKLSGLLTVWGFGALAFVTSIGALVVATGLSRTQWQAMGGTSASGLQMAWHTVMRGYMFARNAFRAEMDLPTRTRRRMHKKAMEEVAEENLESAEARISPKLFGKPPVSEKRAAVVQKPEEKKEKPKSKKAQQSSLELGHSEGTFTFPALSLLKEGKKSKTKSLSESALEQNAKLLESVLQDFGVNGKITAIRPGPVVTLYELEPAAGVRAQRVIGLADDIARSMSAVSARIAAVPGKNVIGIELPNQQRDMVSFREVLESDAYGNTDLRIPLALGKDIGGDVVVVDLAKMPHLLVAGTTGAGKSVAVNAMILSIIYRLSPEQCKFIMIDPKMLELSVYDGIPHLLTPVVTEPGKAVVALKWTVKEMENRYRLMSTLGVKNIAGYNEKIKAAVENEEVLTRRVQTGFDPDTGKPVMEDVPLDMTPLPFIVVVVDEMADLMIVAGKDIEGSIQRLAQMARAAGIHIIMATQRPSVDVITGVIKANFPTRISFQVTSRIDSRTILNEMGAEQLLGQGDMLYMSGGSRIQRVHGPFVTDKEVENVVQHLKDQGEPVYMEDVTTETDEVDGFGAEGGGSGDDFYDQAVAIVCNDDKVSTSYIQRKLRIGYNRAADIIDRMEKEGVISAPNHVGKREVLARVPSKEYG
ncbi:MAG: DNA translocase FtsK 4TM domain-containing protein [Alphaproteobacteria bacterium]|nr:DNA translocase FtsK 4TM domain-containing protein [Alphaproteobacteria bacterium]